MGIRGRLTLLVPGIVALALAGLATLQVQRERDEALEDFRAHNVKLLQTIGLNAAVQLAQNDISTLDTLVSHLSESMAERDMLELAVIDDAGRVLAHSRPERFNTLATDSFSHQAIHTDGPGWRRDGEIFYVSAPSVSGIRWGTVTATFSLARLNAHARRTRDLLTATTMVLFGIVGVALYLGLDRLVVRPVRTLQQTVRRMSEGHLSARVPKLPGPELRELSETVNSMAKALQEQRATLEQAVEARTHELQEANARLERLAVTDGLTGVFNHRRFQEAINAELLRARRHGRPLSVLMFDVDFFKRVNDAMGHPAGDELLRRLAQVLSEELRQTDLIARYGGEEFTVLLPESTGREALQVAERMRQAVETKLNDGTTPWPQRITVSAGVATFPEDGDNAHDVLSAADQAMYVAKRQGRNRVIGARGAPS